MGLHNIAAMTTATSGTGTITLGSAVSGYNTFANAGVVTGETVTYSIKDGTAREVGTGVYTASGTTLTRATVYSSTDGGNKINLSGSAEVYLTAAAENIIDSATGAEGSEPASPNTGDVYFPSAGGYLKRYSGSAWTPWGLIQPMTDPNLQTFSWVNQGGATTDVTRGGIYLSAPATGASHHLLVKSAPSTPYTIVVGFLPWLQGATGAQAGVYFRESSGAKISGICAIGNGRGIEVQKWNSPTSFNAVYTTNAWIGAGFYPQIIWLAIVDDGADRKYGTSPDGYHWTVVHSVGRTDFLTADQVGFSLDAESANTDMSAWLLSYKEETSALF